MIAGSSEKPPNPTVKGTLTYLEVYGIMLRYFFSPVASLTDRIKYAGIVVHFLGIWRNFLQLHDKRQLKTHFITRECYLDVIISCHFATMLICYMRDCFPDVECRLNLTGSDSCESFFSLNGQWIGNKHNYSFQEMKCNINHMVRLQSIQSDPGGPVFPRAHQKQENVWKKQHRHSSPCNLKDYPSKGMEAEAWKDGIKLAQSKARYVGMVPNYFTKNDEDASDPDQLFFSPFHHENTEDANLENDMISEGDMEDDYEMSWEEEEDSYALDDLSSAREAISMSLEDEEIGGIGDSTTTKISPTITVPGYGRLYKSTLVKQLNEGPILSHDRLTRVRQIQSSCQPGQSQQVVPDDAISLFEDYAFIYDNKICYGRLERMRKSSKSRGMVEYKRPVAFSDKSRAEILLLFHQYNVERNVFELDANEVLEISATKVISHINLSFNSEQELIGDPLELDAIATELTRRTRKRKEPNPEPQQNIQNLHEQQDDGMMRTLVVPQNESDSNVRRSRRARTVLTSMSNFL